MTTTALAIVLASAILTPSPRPSEAALALSRGDFEAAQRLPARDAEEAAYIEAQVHLAGHRIEEAGTALEKLPVGAPGHAELRWRLARARGAAAEIRAAAQAYCRSDRTRRSCADAELYGSDTPAQRVTLEAPTEVPLAPSAPFPLTLGTSGEVKTGWIVDTGASESVISPTLARQLGARITEAAFPVGVVAGGAMVEARLAVVPEVVFGGVKIEHLPVLVMDMPELEANGVMGILSPQQGLEGLRVTLDYARHRMHLAPGGGAPIEGTTVPYYRAGLDLAIPARVGGGPVALFGLDTGMSGACAVSTDYVPEAAADAPKVQLAGAGARLDAQQLPAARVEVGSDSLGEGACVRSPMRKEGIRLSGLLGNALWAKGTLVLDTVERTVTIQPAAPSRN